jgi:MFS family permease
MSSEPSSPASAAHVSFAALRHSGYRLFFLGNTTAMMADNIEHVISYWVMYQKFHSSALAGFAVVSHWVPFLLFSGYSGVLAARYDPRRMIQLGMLLFMGVSVTWGILFMTGTLQMWEAMLLLTVHGVAGVLWTPAAQLMIYDIVGREHLQSAVRLGAIGRYLGTLLGPAVGSGLLLAAGPAYGIFINALIYLPLFLWLWKAPYGPRFRTDPTPARTAVRGLADAFATLRAIAGNRVIVTMTLLAGGASFFIGTAYQAQMPGFALDLGHGNPGVSYTVLLGADAAGALCAGFLLEARGLLQPSVSSALLIATIWSAALGSFALVHAYPLAVAMLFVAGFSELSFSAMAQTLVQLRAPVALRGHVIGVFVMASLGLRAFSGLTVGFLGSVVGIHAALALSAVGVLLVIAILWITNLRAAQNIE